MKSFIIHNPNDTLSVTLASESLESCNRFGIRPELFDGCFGDDIDFKIKKYNLFPSTEVPKLTVGEQGCFVSHYELWNNCLSDNVPYFIMEHDIQLKSSVLEDVTTRFDDVLNLDYCSSFRKTIDKYLECSKNTSNTVSIEQIYKGVSNTKPTWKSAKTYHVVGAHAYIIKPSAAKKLIDAAHRDGFLPVDVHINCHYVDMYITKPSIARTCDFMLNTKNRVKFSSTKGYKPNAS